MGGSSGSSTDSSTSGATASSFRTAAASRHV
jgi:hypothetical protein